MQLANYLDWRCSYEVQRSQEVDKLLGFILRAIFSTHVLASFVLINAHLKFAFVSDTGPVEFWPDPFSLFALERAGHETKH